jgi:hypothetical protein
MASRLTHGSINPFQKDQIGSRAKKETAGMQMNTPKSNMVIQAIGIDTSTLECQEATKCISNMQQLQDWMNPSPNSNGTKEELGNHTVKGSGTEVKKIKSVFNTK